MQDARTYHLARPTAVTPFWADVELDVAPSGTKAVRFVEESKGNPVMLPLPQSTDLKLDFPTASHATLVRRGVLSCHSSPSCDLVLTLPSEAASE